MNFLNIAVWNQLPEDTRRLLSMAGYGPNDISSTSDAELLRIEGLGPKKVATIRRFYPYRAQFRTGSRTVGVHAAFDINGEFGDSEREYLNNAVSDALQKLCKQKKASPDNFRTKVNFVESRAFERSPRAVMEVDERGVTNVMSDVPLEVMAINKHRPTVNRALKHQDPDEIDLIPSTMDKKDSSSYGLFHRQESDVLPEDVERYYQYTEDRPEVNRYTRTVLRMLKLSGELLD